ncbi:MAG: alcohol dehydrogenase [Eubacteriales bacterium]|nr:alcohol dehydrogenase [Eubacteriales bacterium]
MKMHKIDDIIDVLKNERESDNEYVGFGTDEYGHTVMILKEHEPGWYDEDGCGEAVEELTLLHDEGEY